MKKTFVYMNDEKKYFTHILLQWNKKANNRAMPWKGEKDPYKIWVSEIILQQTRVEQGWAYYNRFIKAYPTVQHLAKAPETEVFKLWEGLGYYSRCKNLIATSQFIIRQYNGVFPDKYEDILQLKGVGPYTAAAIASFAYSLPYAVVDGNVFRVLSRFFANATPIDSSNGKKIFTILANELLYKKMPGIYNQALMDFGAVICKPKLPLCNDCPLKNKCGALINNLVQVLPIKEKKVIQKTRWLYYFILEHNKKVFVRKRGAKDIWENLYEFVLVERPGVTETARLIKLLGEEKILVKNEFTLQTISALYRQKLTHQTIQGQFIHIQLKKPTSPPGYKTVSAKALKNLPFPKLITAYLKDKNVSLN